MSTCNFDRHNLLRTDIARCPISNTLGYHFPYNISRKQYDLSSYREDYSIGRIEIEECEKLTKDLDQLASPIAYPYPWAMIIWPLRILNVSIFIAIYYIFEKPYYKNSPLNATSKLRDDFIGGFLIAMIGFTSLVLISSLVSLRWPNYLAKMKDLIKLIIARHHKYTFNSQASITVSLHQGYVSIMFNWTIADKIMETRQAEYQKQQEIVPPQIEQKRAEDINLDNIHK